VEAAHTATQTAPIWHKRFEQLAVRIGKPKATVALARKLLVLIWHVLTRQEADRQADPSGVARRMLRWGTNYGLATRHGLSRAAFVRDKLDRVGVGQDLRELTYGDYIFDLQGLGPPRALRKRTAPKRQEAMGLRAAHDESRVRDRTATSIPAVSCLADGIVEGVCNAHVAAQFYGYSIPA